MTDDTKEGTIDEEIVVMLPENLFQGLRQEQNIARQDFKNQ